jgi:hypothetical protein
VFKRMFRVRHQETVTRHNQKVIIFYTVLSSVISCHLVVNGRFGET